MAGRLPDTRRFRVVTARQGEFGDLNGERESLETKDGERESLETKDGDRERMETSRARQECRVQKRITELHLTLDSPVNFGPGEEVPHLGSGPAHRRATSITGISGTAAVGGASIGSGREGQVGQPGGTDFGPGVERSSGPCAKGK